jgi:hypothetical protein
MARNRVIYQSEALYTSSGIQSSATGEHFQLERVQSANYNFTINRQDINQYGQAARIDSLVMDAPTVGLDFSYYLTNGGNEKALGFDVGNSNQFAEGHMTYTSGKNFYIVTADEGKDAVDSNAVAADRKSVIGLGNAYLSDYTVDLAVGSLPTVSVSMECSNINSDTVLGGDNTQITNISLPSVDITDGTPYSSTNASLAAPTTGESTLTALRPGDISVNIVALDGVALSDLDGPNSEDAIHIQSASLSIPLSRTPLQRLGTRFNYARTVDFPVNATLSVNAICNDVTQQNLATILNDNAGYQVSVTLNDKDGAPQMTYTLKGCRIDSESFSSSIGSNKSVDLTFSTQIGGTNDTANGVFALGSFTDAVFS